MKRPYHVSATVTISIHTTVMATSAREAKEIAEEREMPPISWPGKDENHTELWCDSGEIDGPARCLKAEARR